MGMREIAAQFEHKCDGCGVTQLSASKSRPSYWTGLNILADAYDFQGAAVANAGVNRVLCADCSTVVHKAVNDSIVARRAALAQADGEVR